MSNSTSMNDQTQPRPKGYHIGYLKYCFGILFLIIGASFVVLFINNRPPHIKIPPQKLPTTNAWDYFVKAGNMLPSGSKVAYGPASSTEPLNSWTMAEYKQYMKLNAPALAVFRQGLSKPFMSPRSKSYDDLHFGQYAKFREIARRLSSEALYHEKVGKYGSAASSALDAVDLGVTIPKGGVMIDALVGAALVSIGGKRLEQIIPKLTPDELYHAAKRLDAINDKHIPFSEIATEEAYTCALLSTQLYGSNDFRKEVMNPRNWTSFDSIKKPRQLWSDLEEVFCNKQKMIRQTMQYYEAVAKEQQKPYTGKSNIPVPSNLLMEGYSAFDYNPAVNCRAAYTRAEAMLILMQTEIALRMYRFDHGSYPAKLMNLVPEYLEKAPVDPFGRSKPLKYRLKKNDSDFLLYSIGSDMIDNSGSPAQWSGESTLGDLVVGKW